MPPGLDPSGRKVHFRPTPSAEQVGLDGNHARIAVLKMADGNACLELIEYLHPVAIETEPT